MNKYIAHRGLHNKEIPENSLKAFQNAILNNFDIELDVQVTKDNVYIVFHDDNTYRLTNKKHFIKKTNYNTIQKLFLKKTKEKIPTLKEVLSLVNGQVYLDIEIKKMNKIKKRVKEIYAILKDYKGSYSIKSFDPRIPYYYKKICPSINCGVLCYNFKNADIPNFLKIILRKLLYLKIYKPDFIAYKIDDYDLLIDKIIKKYNIPLYFWTIDNKDKLKKAQKFKGNIIFENINIEKKYK